MYMKIHKAGFGVIFVALLIMAGVIFSLIFFNSHSIILNSIGIAFFLLLLFLIRFFRFPKRNINFSKNDVMASADGTIVAIEEVFEDEFIKDKCIQISIFMSIWNVHINWLPVLGKVLHTRHCSGKYMAAWLPKSSSENERAITIIESINSGKILVKQIAGALARRIITYAKEGDVVKAGDQLGFIRFGSRVDILIPVGSDVKVKLDEKVIGGITLLAVFPK